jgi:uncharacterized protein (TIGR02466 family)
MEGTRVGLFHVPILKRENVELPHAEIESYIRKAFSDFGAYTSYYDHKFNEELLKAIPYREEMLGQMYSMCVDLLKSRGAGPGMWKGRRVCPWVSLYTEGESHTLHNHPKAVVAGTYYPYADRDSVDIRFKNPSSNLIQMADHWIDGNSPELWHFHSPRTGHMNVWPSWLEHQIGRQGPVPNNRSRIAVSFNFQ